MSILLFDIGNVIVDADHKITHRKLVEYGVPLDRAELFFKAPEYLELTEVLFLDGTFMKRW